MMQHHHHRSEISVSNDSSIIEGMMSKASRYSPEEKKERIERYRSKRNQRNFNKKIKVLTLFCISPMLYKIKKHYPILNYKETQQ